MASVKKYLAAFKHIAPSDMEYYLEEMAANGYILEPLSQSGLFCMSFDESKPEKVKYVVDVTGLQKHLYMKTLVDKGWEYMGQVTNCHVWKMSYEGNDRPADFADQRCIRKHCIRLGLFFALIALLMLFLFGAYIYLIYKEHAVAMEVKHDVLYAVLAALQIPFTAIFAILSAKLFKEAGKRLQNIERNMSFRQSEAAKEEREAVLEFEGEYIDQEYAEEYDDIDEDI